MSKQQFVYVIFIRATPDKVFHALIEPSATREYWLHNNISDWKPGSNWEHRRLDGSAVDVVGQVVVFDPPRQLVMTWASPVDHEDPTKHSHVTFDIEPVADVTRLALSHDDLPSETYDEAAAGWSSVLSSLKSFLETGKSLGDLWS